MLSGTDRYGTGRTPFVGRQRELDALLARLGTAGGGNGGVVLVAGEPGIGKTRLLAELAGQSRPHGWQVLTGRAYESEGMPPYLPFAEALRDYVRGCPPDILRPQLGDGAAEVALMVREVRSRLSELPASPALGAEDERYRLFEAVCDFLLAIAADLSPQPPPLNGRGGQTGVGPPGPSEVSSSNSPSPFGV